MSARETILDAVRSGLGNTAVDPAAVRRDADALLQDLPSIRPALLADGLVDAFIARVTSPKVAATAECIASASELPAAVGRYLEARGLPAVVALQPAAPLQDLDWSGFELHDKVAPDEMIAIGFAHMVKIAQGDVTPEAEQDRLVLHDLLVFHRPHGNSRQRITVQQRHGEMEIGQGRQRLDRGKATAQRQRWAQAPLDRMRPPAHRPEDEALPFTEASDGLVQVDIHRLLSMAERHAKRDGARTVPDSRPPSRWEEGLAYMQMPRNNINRAQRSLARAIIESATWLCRVTH